MNEKNIEAMANVAQEAVKTGKGKKAIGTIVGGIVLGGIVYGVKKLKDRRAVGCDEDYEGEAEEYEESSEEEPANEE